MKSDIEIAREVQLRPIEEIAAKLGLQKEEIEQYGKYKAKIARKPGAQKGKLILVTAINPTPLGEGKTMISFNEVPILTRKFVGILTPSPVHVKFLFITGSFHLIALHNPAIVDTLNTIIPSFAGNTPAGTLMPRPVLIISISQPCG